MKMAVSILFGLMVSGQVFATECSVFKPNESRAIARFIATGDTRFSLIPVNASDSTPYLGSLKDGADVFWGETNEAVALINGTQLVTNNGVVLTVAQNAVSDASGKIIGVSGGADCTPAMSLAGVALLLIRGQL